MTETNDPPNLTAHELITTTRSVRRRLDRSREVELGTILDCLDDALQAPNGGDDEAWRWVVVLDRQRREKIAEVYARANRAFAEHLRERADAGDRTAARKVASSSSFWDHLGDVPALVVASYAPSDWFDGSSYALASAYGSVFPAVWNFQLACRLRGLGSCIMTSHLRFEDEIAEIIDLDPRFRQVAMVGVGHLVGTEFQPARRHPLDEVVRIDSWSGPK